MKISEKYKVRDMVGQHVVIMQGRSGGDMTRIISLNDTSLFLWNHFLGKDFNTTEVADALVSEYGIDFSKATVDAQMWCKKLSECGLLEA